MREDHGLTGLDFILLLIACLSSCNGCDQTDKIKRQLDRIEARLPAPEK